MNVKMCSNTRSYQFTVVTTLIVCALIQIFFTKLVLAVQPSLLGDPIKIAYIGGLSGRESQASQKSLKALRLAVKEFNNKGGILGRKIEVLPFDNQSVSAANISAFEKAKASGVVAITGLHISNDALIVSELAEKERIPLVVASATHPDISRGKKYCVQVCFTDDMQGALLASFAKKRQKFKKIISIVDVSDSASLRVAAAFTRAFNQDDGTIIESLNIRSGEQEFSQIVKVVKDSAGVEAIHISASSIESGYLIKQLFEAGVKLPLIGTDNWQNQNLSQALSSLDQKKIQATFPAHWHQGVKNAASRHFVDAFEREYHEKVTSFDADTVLTYDAGLLLLNAIAQAKSTDSEKITLALHKISITGVTGLIKIGVDGYPKKTIFLLKMLNGKMMANGSVL